MTIGPQELGAEKALQSLLPSGSSVYFALYVDETATVECTDATYERVGYTGWVQSEDVDGYHRSNTGPITFPAFTAAVHIGAIGWFEADSGGDPIWTSVLSFYAAGIDIDAGDFIEVPAGLFTMTVPKP